MTGLIIFTLFCLVLIIYLSVRHNRLLKDYIKVVDNGHNIAINYAKYSAFIAEKDLIDDYVEFVEGRE